ncbi:MAG: 2-succinyl-5-enolpyruvyl-6-hydroxy-3-cyclohexene-1-carboxylate synthase [Flavobacteriaceae bacterium]|jgi:2-succinyl-5-enolpyruvyl-6-hydroxy-3-cyclohexene-1-carboxylate synthase
MRIRTTNKSGISTFVDECTRNGLKHVVCSPGSRNAPIVIALDQHPDIQTIVVHDERSAAFYALGMSIQLGEPVGVVCTSGSAMLNYYPAVAEAYYQGVPLVVMSADRPVEWIDQGDGQTINQKGVYTKHIRTEVIISETIGEKDDLSEQVSSAFEAALVGWRGPIHFNFPLTEPLYDLEDVEWNRKPKIEHPSEGFSLSPSQKIELSKKWNDAPKKLILCGQLDRNPALRAKLLELSDDSSIAVLVENTSNLVGQRWVHCIDRTLSGISVEEIEAFQPDLLITLGDAIISKRIKSFLRDSTIKSHWRIGHAFPEMDTYRALTASFKSEPSTFIDELLKLELDRNQSDFGSKWKQRDFVIQENQKPFKQDITYSDLAVFDTLLDYLPENCHLHMANSSVIRYCQLFDPVPSINYFSNRGTSGIDGSSSTAAGVAIVSPESCNVLITGDVSFFYDSNALWNNHLPSNLRIFMINNEGGGIFRIIDGPRKSDQLEKYFEAHHTNKAEFICKAHDVGYVKADSVLEIEAQLESFFEESDRPKLMEIFTPREVNDSILKLFFEAAKSV